MNDQLMCLARIREALNDRGRMTQDELVQHVRKMVAELCRQGLEAWMRGDYQTADRLAALVGDPLPSEHEKEDSK